MKELIYCISDIFNNETQTGCLHQYNAICFHIPAYQRGYKWSSDKNGAVTILLKDLFNQYFKSKKDGKKEYFLQYITVKPIQVNDKNCLEVIDGQQRLTTLSIILSCITCILEIPNKSENKLDYAIRENFFEDYIYKSEDLKNLVAKNWNDIESEDDLNKQDIHYIFSATKTCFEEFNGKKYKNELSQFYEYLLNYVKLIVNSVETHVNSETVFKNLNSNKVPLTETELIKGLFITKVGRFNTRENTLTFNEISEKRTQIGRQWDELSNWANQSAIKNFYFNADTDGMYQLLTLSVYKTNINQNFNIRNSDFPLFNYFLEKEDFVKHFNDVVETKNILDSWFHNTKIYNLLGYLRYAEKEKFSLKQLANKLKSETKTSLINSLTKQKETLLNNIDLDNISYQDGDTKKQIHQALLALNVFPKGQEDLKFNFLKFKQENWTLEHIFPQTPEGKNIILTDSGKEAIKTILGESYTNEIEEVLKKETRTDDEKQIYYQALREHPAINSIGNMCLLSDSDNASNGNKFFNEKRENILSRIQKGSFVPKHTFDVFSKMFKNANTKNMDSWTGNDIENHKEHIKETLNIVNNNESR